MYNILLIVCCLVAGIFLQRLRFLPDRLPYYLNVYLIYVVLPALVLRYLPSIDLQFKLLLPIASAWISFGLSWLIFGSLGEKLNWSNSLTGCLVITAGLANTSFVGFPIIQALYGEEGMKIALLIDQAGSFIIVSSVAVIVASFYSPGKKRKRDIFNKIITFPPFAFFAIAILMNIYNVQPVGLFDTFLNIISATLTPVALIAVGLQVKINTNAIQSKYLWMGLGYKLILIPAIILMLLGGIFRLEGLMLKVSVLESAMAPMITGSIIAISHDLEPKLASLLVGLGIPLSFVTVGIWYLVLG